jgi:hypothetical protein
MWLIFIHTRRVPQRLETRYEGVALMDYDDVIHRLVPSSSGPDRIMVRGVDA